MRVFDDEFNMQAYIQKRLLEVEGLESRRVFKDVVGKVLLELHHEIEEQYQGLENRVFAEVPMKPEGPPIVTNIIDKKLYDVTDTFLRPMQPGDLKEHRIDSEELLASLEAQKPFLLYTVFLQADYLETCKFDQAERIFSGVIKTQHNEYTARFHVCRNIGYLQQIEDLYRVFQMNYLPWRSVCAPYLFKLFDIYIDTIENWDQKEIIEEAVIDFEEYKQVVKYNPLPLWNIKPLFLRTSTYPEPCVDKTNYEHRVFKRQFKENARYVVTNSDVMITNIRWQRGDLLISCLNQNPVRWEMYAFNPPVVNSYPNRCQSNYKKDSFSGRLTGVFQQSPKTKLELNRLLNSFFYDEDLSFVDVSLIPNYPNKETYSVDYFIQDELRTGKWETAMQIDFRPRNRDFYLNRDIMSFLVSHVQQHFPEYECCGRLV